MSLPVCCSVHVHCGLCSARHGLGLLRYVKCPSGLVTELNACTRLHHFIMTWSWL